MKQQCPGDLAGPRDMNGVPGTLPVSLPAHALHLILCQRNGAQKADVVA